MYIEQIPAYYQICISILQHLHSNESLTRHVRDKQKHCLNSAAVGCGCEKKTEVYVWFTFLTSYRVQVSTGCQTRHGHSEEWPPTRLIPLQTKTEFPWSTHAERRSQNMMNQPGRTASSTMFGFISQISTFGPNL